jgi:hypothetical protein
VNHDDIYADMCALRDRAAESYGDPTYRRLLEGHSVAVVGPARTSIGRKRGAVIDSHDLVVRFNDAFEQFPIPPVLAGDIGSRAHILYCNQSILKNRIVGRTTSTQLRLMQAFDAAGVRVVACTNNSLNFTSTGEPTAACSAGDSGTMPALAAFLKTHRPGTGVRVVHEASELLNRWLIGNWPRTGLVALVDLLSFPIARLSVSGMTFYHGGGHLPDYNVFSPVVVDDELVLIASIQCHHADTGGGMPGGYNAEAIDIWAEGVRFPALKLYEPTQDDRISVVRGRLQGKRTQEYLLVAQQTGTFQIPSIAFAYFDPEARRYETVRTPPLTLTVTPGEPQVFGRAFFRSARDLAGVRSSMSQTAIAATRPSS